MLACLRACRRALLHACALARLQPCAPACLRACTLPRSRTCALAHLCVARCPNVHGLGFPLSHLDIAPASHRHTARMAIFQSPHGGIVLSSHCPIVHPIAPVPSVLATSSSSVAMMCCSLNVLHTTHLTNIALRSLEAAIAQFGERQTEDLKVSGIIGIGCILAQVRNTVFYGVLQRRVLSYLSYIVP